MDARYFFSDDCETVRLISEKTINGGLQCLIFIGHQDKGEIKHRIVKIVTNEYTTRYHTSENEGYVFTVQGSLNLLCSPDGTLTQFHLSQAEYIPDYSE